MSTIDDKHSMDHDQGHFRDNVKVSSRVSYLPSVLLLIPLFSCVQVQVIVMAIGQVAVNKHRAITAFLSL